MEKSITIQRKTNFKVILFFVLLFIAFFVAYNTFVSNSIVTHTNIQYYEKTNGKNGKHSNLKSRQTAKEKYNILKKKYQNLRSKPNKTPDDKNLLKKLQKQLKKLKKIIDFSGETHSRTQKK